MPATAVGQIVMESRQLTIQRVGEFCFGSFPSFKLLPERSPLVALIRWEQSKYPIGRLFFLGRLFEIANCVVDKGIPGIDLHQIMDQRHPDYARNDDRLIRVIGKPHRSDRQVPAMFGSVLATVGRQDVTLPVHLFQPVHFENELDLTLQSISQVARESVGSIHTCFAVIAWCHSRFVPFSVPQPKIGFNMVDWCASSVAKLRYYRIRLEASKPIFPSPAPI